MKLLILGATGAFGTALETACLKKRWDFTPLGHRDFEITDHASLERAVKKHRPGAVVNAVAMVGINPCEEAPEKAWAVNTTAALNLARICQANDLLLVQPSTHAVFDGTKMGPYSEEDIPYPTSIYSASKFSGECLAAVYCKKHYIIRFPTLFGPRRNQSPGFVDKVLGWLKEKEEIRIADDKIDSPSYTLDLAEALLEMIQNEVPYGTYHLSNSGQTSYYDFVRKIVSLLGASVRVVAAKDKDFEALAHKPLKTALKSSNLPPLRNWQEALAAYLASLPQ